MARKPAKTRGLYKRGKTWWICYVDAAGNYHRESAQTEYKTKAQGLLDQRRSEARNAPLAPLRVYGGETFSDLCDMYKEAFQHQRSYQKEKRYRIEKLRQEFGSIKLQNLGAHIVEAYLSRRRTVDEVKPATCNRELTIIKHMLSKAVDWEVMQSGPAAKVLRIKKLKERNTRNNYLSEEQLTALLESSFEPLKSIIWVAVCTGMRRGELLRITWNDLDFNAGYIHVGDTKTGHSRKVPMGRARDVLKSQPKMGPFVFTNKIGEPIKDFRGAFLGACKRAGIEDLHFHDLRHTFCSHMVMAGYPLPLIKKITGHKSLEMLDRYVHLNEDMVKESVETLYQGTNVTFASQ